MKYVIQIRLIDGRVWAENYGIGAEAALGAMMDLIAQELPHGACEIVLLREEYYPQARTVAVKSVRIN